MMPVDGYIQLHMEPLRRFLFFNTGLTDIPDI